MLTGEPPFSAESYARLLVLIATEPPPKLRDGRPELPRSLEKLIARCLEKKPERRFASAAELVDALLVAAGGALLPGRPSHMPPDDTIEEIVDGEDTRPDPVSEATPTSETRPVRGRAAAAAVPPSAAPLLRSAEPGLLADDLPFDEVVITERHAIRVLSARAFLELPLSERIAHVMSRTVTFHKDGVEVDRQTALAKLRERRDASSS
jgi:serine/threonine protein kinase